MPVFLRPNTRLKFNLNAKTSRWAASEIMRTGPMPLYYTVSRPGAFGGNRSATGDE
jgi:hypothetical protein